jgi:hypothetical protein
VQGNDVVDIDTLNNGAGIVVPVAIQNHALESLRDGLTKDNSAVSRLENVSDLLVRTLGHRNEAETGLAGLGVVGNTIHNNPLIVVLFLGRSSIVFSITEGNHRTNVGVADPKPGSRANHLIDDISIFLVDSFERHLREVGDTGHRASTDGLDGRDNGLIGHGIEVSHFYTLHRFVSV